VNRINPPSTTEMLPELRMVSQLLRELLTITRYPPARDKMTKAIMRLEGMIKRLEAMRALEQRRP
jgi:hypothetical protein